jgi:hypothetical protein
MAYKKSTKSLKKNTKPRKMKMGKTMPVKVSNTATYAKLAGSAPMVMKNV